MHRSLRAAAGHLRAAALLGALALAVSGCAYLERVSLSSNETAGDGDAGWLAALSSDGRYVAFAANGTPLVAGVPAAGLTHMYVRDLATGTTEIVDVSSGGVAGNASAGVTPSISADGRYVAFESNADNLVAGDTNYSTDVFVRDRTAGTTQRASIAFDGAEGDDDSVEPSISADGTRVAFTATAENLVFDDTNGADDVFVRDRTAGTTVRASVKSNGDEGDELEDSYEAKISADGSVVGFATYEPFVSDDTNWEEDVYVRELVTAKTKLVSRNNNGSVATQGGSGPPAISSDGRYVAFISFGNLDGLGVPVALEVFVRDRVAGTTARVTQVVTGTKANGHSLFPSMSGDGRYVAFRSGATNLVAGDTNGFDDMFVRDRTEGRTWKVSTSMFLAQTSALTYAGTISNDGNIVVFTTAAGLQGYWGEPPDNGKIDVYARKVRTLEVTGMAPSSVTRGVSTPVTITGTGFEPGAVPVLPFASSISGVTVVSTTQITATIVVSAGYATGPMTFWVENPGPAWKSVIGSFGPCAACATIL